MPKASKFLKSIWGYVTKCKDVLETAMWYYATYEALHKLWLHVF